MVAAVVVALSGCVSGPKGPGSVVGIIEGPVPLGAAILEVRGPDVLGFEGIDGTRVFHAMMTEGVHRVLLVGDVPGNLRFRVQVADVGAPPPTGAVLSAADGANFPIPSVQAFVVKLSR
jgi:hypothetical protein